MKRALLSVFVLVTLGIFGLGMTQNALAVDPFKGVCDTNPSNSQNQNSSVCDCTTNPTAPACQDPITGTTQEGILIKATKIVALVTGIAAVVMITIGGLQFVLASGDAKRVESARNTLLYAAIGLVIAIIAEGLIRFVLKNV